MTDKTKPIIFNTEMVRAVMDGRKTQTRRPVKVPESEHPDGWVLDLDLHGGSAFYNEITEENRMVKSPYKAHDILWVRETFAYESAEFDTISLKQIRPAVTLYRADWTPDSAEPRWYPSIHMPEHLARLFLRVTDVRVERLQDISWDDAVAEGFRGYRPLQIEPKDDFSRTWDRIYGPKGIGWNQNPWVWVIEFEKIEKNV